VKKIVVGMSGGVDSSVAAFLLKKQGHEVVGAIMKIWRGAFDANIKRHACYGPDEDHDIETAKIVCEQIGIPLHVIDCAEKYEDIVLKYFREEYLAGKTPNPCVRCNQMVKFGALPELVRSAGIEFDYFATGHYANVEYNANAKRYLLKKSKDAKKDQTYFLYRLSQGQLSKALFPLGNYLKDEVREIACSANLSVHDKKESQDFYGGDIKELLQKDNTPGDIVTSQGEILGRHNGVWHYTIGQRKGLGVSSTEPLYVIAIDAENNKIIVGNEKETYNNSCSVSHCNWIAFEKLSETIPVEVKVRSTSKPVPAAIAPLSEDRVEVTFKEPVSIVAPGQSAVFYNGDIVVGGGIIQKGLQF
jgi:tRNA-specific 2-thiouridylase